MTNHHHNHSHGSPLNGQTHYSNAFLIGIIFNLTFVFIEASYGLLANSLALLADAGHNLSDVLGLVIAWIASVLVQKKPNSIYTYGLRSSSIFAALFNALILLFAVGGVAWEAFGRLSSSPPVMANTVIVVAAIGILINGGTAYLFSKGRKEDLNMKGAYLHMLADTFVSVAVVVAGLVIRKTGWNWIDPVLSLIVSLVILKSTWSLLRDSGNLALNAVPVGIEHNEVQNFLKSKKNVVAVHDLHIWGMSTTENALTAHLIMPGGHPGDGFLHHLAEELRIQFNIHHVTVQIEIGNDPHHQCALLPDDVV